MRSVLQINCWECAGAYRVFRREAGSYFRWVILRLPVAPDCVWVNKYTVGALLFVIHGKPVAGVLMPNDLAMSFN